MTTLATVPFTLMFRISQAIRSLWRQIDFVVGTWVIVPRAEI
jgi:hypothetical protein